MLNQEFISNGFRFISADNYLNEENLASIHDLKKIFEIDLLPDGSDIRKRAYLKLHWNCKNQEITVADNQHYFQTAQSNTLDGGKIRQFKIMDKKILSIPVVVDMINKNLQLIKDCAIFKSQSSLTIGLHFIRYQALENGASNSSPAWLHKDDEPLVFVHLINLSRYTLGGDNLIADDAQKKVTHVVRLENEMDTLVLNKNVYHAVTPLGSKKGISHRDVILFTVEPEYTQQ